MLIGMHAIWSTRMYVCIQILECWNGKRQIHYFGSTMILEHFYFFLTFSVLPIFFIYSFHAYLFYFFSFRTTFSIFSFLFERGVFVYEYSNIRAWISSLSVLFFFLHNIETCIFLFMPSSFDVRAHKQHLQYVYSGSCKKVRIQLFEYRCGNTHILNACRYFQALNRVRT